MFSISTKGDYGLLLLSTLSAQGSIEKYLSLREIANEKKLSLKYLSNIAATLKSAGIIKSKEGRDGGYTLTRDPNTLTLMEILEVLEGPIAPVRCCNGGTTDKTKTCGAAQSCTVKFAWQDATELMTNYLKSKTLADISQPH